jgi:diacylglycerol kinase family enzyme
VINRYSCVPSSKHIRNLARDAQIVEVDFFMAGGDGSVSFVIAGLVGREIALGNVPQALLMKKRKY